MTLVRSYELKVPGWASSAGRRALLPVDYSARPENNF